MLEPAFREVDVRQTWHSRHRLSHPFTLNRRILYRLTSLFFRKKLHHPFRFHATCPIFVAVYKQLSRFDQISSYCYFPYEEAFPDAVTHPGDGRRDFWRRVHLYPNGDLLAIFESLGVIKVDKDSNLLWSVNNGGHHDFWIHENGTIYILSRKARIIEEVNERHPILEDFITVLSPEGRELRRYSVLEAVLGSNFSALFNYSRGEGDVFHTNSLEILDGRYEYASPAFKAGNALISMANINAIAVIDLASNQVVWALGGLFAYQHDPTFVEGGNLLLFDNFGARPYSRVIELNPTTQEIAWAYGGDDGRPFFSEMCGTSQRLPNGNTLITETAAGRAFEVTPAGHTVWDFFNPHRAGDEEQYIAVIPEMKRLAGDYPSEWLRR